MKSPSMVFAVAVALCCQGVSAQWALTRAPYGGDITCLLPCPNGSRGTYLYVGTADGKGMGGGVFRSTDNGVSWTAADTQFPRVAAVSTLAATAFTRGMMIFAGTGSGDSPGQGAFVSDNNGKSWTPISQGLPGHHYSPTGYQPILGMAVIPNAQMYGRSTIVVATWNRGVYRSIDHGASWTAACEGLPRSYDTTTYDIMNCLTVSDTNIFAGTWQHGVFLSTNGGASWTPAGNGLPKNYDHYDPIKCLESHGSNLFAGTFSGIFMSADNGANWTAANGGLPYGDHSTSLTPVNCLFSREQTLFAGTPDHGIFRSTNNGKEWIPNNVGLPRKSSDTASYTPAGCLASSGQNIFAGIGPDLYRSTDNGTTWSAASIALNNSSCSINAFAITDGNLFAGGAGGLDRSTDNGQNWIPVTWQFSSSLAHALATVGKNLFLGRDGSLGGFNTPKILNPEGHGVFLSTDNGTTWASTNNTGLYLQVYAFVVADPFLLAGTSHGFFATTNYGTTWERINTGLTDTVINALGMKPYPRGMVLFAGTSQRGIFRSHPLGNDWAAVNVGLTDTSITALAVSESYDDIVFAGTAHGLFRSTNLGTNWTSANNGLTDTNVTCLLVNGSNVFAGTRDGGVFLSTDNGTSWTAFNSGLPPGTTIASLGVAGTYLLAGSWGCVWRRPLSDITTSIVPQATAFPRAFSLSQNYPNPFNPTTKLQFTIANPQLTIVKVYDVLGRDIATLVHELMQPGTHTAEFDGSGLASGIYLYRLQTGSFTGMKKMILMK